MPRLGSLQSCIFDGRDATFRRSEGAEVVLLESHSTCKLCISVETGRRNTSFLEMNSTNTCAVDKSFFLCQNKDLRDFAAH